VYRHLNFQTQNVALNMTSTSNFTSSFIFNQKMNFYFTVLSIHILQYIAGELVNPGKNILPS